jgi:competence ComEA-like helix-hairpin-helix protein
MKANIFEPMIIGWSAKLNWTKSELKKAAAVLLAISKANAGEIIPDVELGAETIKVFALQRTEDALARRVAPYARMLRQKLLGPKFSKPLDKQVEHVLPGLVSYEWSDRININTDDVEELCKLPGISRKTALQIIKFRRKKGSYTELAQLARFNGIGTKSMESMQERAYCGTSEQITYMTGELAAFMRQPTFQNYAESIAGAKDSFIWSTGRNEAPKLHILAELKNTLDDVEANKYGVARNLRFTRASKVLRDHKGGEDVNGIKGNEIQAVECGALLYDGQYLPFLSGLFKRATESISVMMFFMRYEDGTKYIANTLVEALITNHKRGLDVRVILDKDAEDDVAKSRLINEPAFQALRRNNVPVLYDREDLMTHSKLVVVDGKHVVVGSHNWTGGSLWAYNDTSIYLESRELAQIYQNFFDKSWGEYSTITERPA